MVGEGEAAVVEDFLGVGEVVVGAGVAVVAVVQEDFLEVEGAGAFEVADPEEVLGAEEAAEDEVVFVDHSTYISICKFTIYMFMV